MQLLSVGKIANCNCNIYTHSLPVLSRITPAERLEQKRKVNGLYQLEYLHLSSSSCPAVIFSVTSDLWHRRLDHLSCSTLKILSNSGVLKSFQFYCSNKCESCYFVKQIVVPFAPSNHIASEIFDLVHWYLGSNHISSLPGYNYYVCFVDDYSRYTWFYVMRSRSELLQIYTGFTNMIYTQLCKCIKKFDLIELENIFHPPWLPVKISWHYFSTILSTHTLTKWNCRA